MSADTAAGSPLVLGIDDGTTAVKVALFDAQLREIASARNFPASVNGRTTTVKSKTASIVPAKRSA